MSIRTSKFQVAPLRGIDQRWDTRPNQATTIENMTWSDQDSWRTSYGYRRLVADFDEINETVGIVNDTPVTISIPTGRVINVYDTDAPPNSIYWFSQNGNSLQWLVYEDTDGKLLYFNGSKAPETPRTTIQYTDGQAFDGTTKSRACKGETVSNTNFAMFGPNLYLVNGQDAPLVYDGKKCTRAGYNGQPNQADAFVTPKTEIRQDFLSGVGFANSKNKFKYAVTFVNERGQESRLSVDTAPVSYDVTGTGKSTQTAGEYRQFIVVDIPTGPPGTVARKIYRTLNLELFIEGTSVVTLPKEQLFGQEFYFVDVIEDNVTELYVDGLSDFDVGALVVPEDFGDFPANSTHIAVYKNTMFVANDMNSEISYSRPLNPEVFPAENLFILGDTQSSLVTGLYPTRDSLVVFKQRGIYLIKGDPVNGFFAQTLSYDIGCTCINSVREVPGIGLVFLANDGLYVLEGTLAVSAYETRFIKLSQGLRDIFKRVNFEYAKKFRSVVYHRDREYWLSVCLDDQRIPETVLKFSYEIGAWSVYDKTKTAGFIEVQDHRGYLYFAGCSVSHDEGARGLYVYGSTNTKDKLGSVASVYETVNIPFNNLYDSFSPARVQARVVGYGNTLNMSVITNREPTSIATTADGDQKRALEDVNFPLYDTAILSTGLTYKEHRPIIVRMDISTMHKGPINELKLRFTCSDEMEILSYLLEGRVGTARDVINLTTKFGGSTTR